MLRQSLFSFAGTMVSSSLFTSALAIIASIGLGNAATYSNPLRSPDGSDPFMVYTGGYYYFMTTTWNDIQISRATTLEGLKTAPKKVVYSASCSSRPTRCANVWAPEVHWINEKWYIYYTAGVAANLDGQRVHVLTGSTCPSLRDVSPNWLTTIQVEIPHGTPSPIPAN